MDGVRKSHDENRVDHRGEGTFSQVFENLKKLQEKKSTVSYFVCTEYSDSGENRGDLFGFYKKGFYEQQYIPCLDPLGR